jgi:hypothetical protein
MGRTQPLSPVRRRMIEFLVAVALLHGAAIAAYYALGVAALTSRAQRWYAWIWMSATIAVVFVGLHRVRRARRAGTGRQS